MAPTPATMVPLGTPAAPFMLPDTEGKLVRLEDFNDASHLLVVFLCNHCPYVKHINPALVEFAREYLGQGLAMVAINANDIERYPADSPERMAEQARELGYPFPYLFDAEQKVAQAYRAACTPDYFLFDRERRLVYRGRFDASTPGNGLPVTGEELRAAVDAALAGREISAEQKPSMGCSIKWKPGNEPGYFQPR